MTKFMQAVAARPFDAELGDDADIVALVVGDRQFEFHFNG